MVNILGNNFIEGPLGVVQLEFNGVDIGKHLKTQRSNSFKM